jgi:tetraacyldisaccharide 4'-kinase
MKRLRKKIQAVIINTDEDRFAAFWERCLYFVSCIYGAGVSIRRRFFSAGILKARRLPCRVISIGNLTVGGTGKTPMTIYVAGLLQNLGHRVAVISRGYQGRKEKSGGVVSDGRTIRLGPEDAGDEPYLMALKLEGVPVLVGKDRFKVGTMAMREFAPDVLVLDDAFQHFKIHRDLDLLLLDAGRPFGNGHLLPRGVLREPVKQLIRSDALVLTRSDGVEMFNGDKQKVRAQFEGKPIFRCNHVPDVLVGSAKLPLTAVGSRPVKYGRDVLKGRRVFVFSGIAGNKDFLQMVNNLGCEVAGDSRFPDHHDYSDSELAAIFDKARQCHVDYVVTTEKDYVRIAYRVSWPVRLLALGIKISFGSETEGFCNYLRETLLEGIPGVAKVEDAGDARRQG